MASNVDEARRLADEFKRQGHFDRLKHGILSQQLQQGDASTSVEQIIRAKVNALVRNMVAEDENLIFKNRGSTSALIESQIFKDGYQELSQGDDGLNVEEYIQEKLNEAALRDEVREKLEETAQNMSTE